MQTAELQTPGMDNLEHTLWSMMSRFERLALDLYREQTPELLSAEKLEFVEALSRQLGSGIDLGILEAPVVRLLAAARSGDAAMVLLVQGLLLEPLAQLIYNAVRTHASSTPESRALASMGEPASLSVQQRLLPLVRQRIGEGEVVFNCFVTVTGPVIALFDTLGEAVDSIFGQRFGLRFSDVMGDLSAELLTACVSLGMNRRKVVVHLTNALMGGEA